MHRKSTAEQLREDVRDLIDAVVPEVESAVQTVAEKTPPLVSKSRAVAVEKGAHAAEALANRLPDNVLDRLPDTVADRLPQPHRRRRKGLLVLGLLGVLGAGFVAARRWQAGKSAAPSSPPPSYPRAVPEDGSGQDVHGTSATADPSDPLVEPRVDRSSPS